MAIKKLVGDLAQTSISPNSTIQGCSTTTASPTVVVTPAVIAAGGLAGVAPGQTVTGAGIPPPTTTGGVTTSTTVLALTATGFTLSANATATGSGVPLTVAGETQVLGLQEWTIDIKLKTPEATTTDDAAWESSLPSSKSWTAKANYMFYDGDPTQQAAIYATINAPGTVTQWNFFPDFVNSDIAFTGLAFVDSISLTAGVGKIIAANVTLKGTGPLKQTVQVAPVTNPATNTGFQAEI